MGGGGGGKKVVVIVMIKDYSNLGDIIYKLVETKRYLYPTLCKCKRMPFCPFMCLYRIILLSAITFPF